MTAEWRTRLVSDLEPVLKQPDPRPSLSPYHDLPYAIFQYPPDEELAVRAEITKLTTRLTTQAAKVVTRISLAERLAVALEEEAPIHRLAEAERKRGVAQAIQTVHNVIADYRPLIDVVVEALPPQTDPTRDIVFLTRAGALFPMYRPHALVERLSTKDVQVATVLFYPGHRDGVGGLKFMGLLDAEPHYRLRIF